MVRKSFSDDEFEQMMASHLPPRSVVHKRKRRSRKIKRLNNQSFARRDGHNRSTNQEVKAEGRSAPLSLSRVARRYGKKELINIAKSLEEEGITDEYPFGEEKEEGLSRLEKRKQVERESKEQRIKLVTIRLLTFLFILLPLAMIITFFYLQNNGRSVKLPVEGNEPDSFEQVEIENKP
ncbi:MAG: hypothetical protein FWJ66_08800 [Caldibacillus sp.]